MTREDKRDLVAASLVMLLLLLASGWIYQAYTPEPHVSSVTPTWKPTPPQVAPATPETTLPVAGSSGTVPVAAGPVGADGTTVPELPGVLVTVPVARQLAPIAGTPSVSQGLYHTCRLSGGQVYCSGKNLHGALGKTNGAGAVDLPVKVQQVVAGQGSTCARGEGRVFCWGYRQGGNGSSTATPVEVPVPPSSKIYNGEGGIVCSVSFESGGLNQVVGELDKGVLHCWGEGIGKEGVTGRDWSDAPVEIARSKDFDDVAVGWRSVCTLTGDVVLKCYGGQPDGSWSIGGKVVARDTGFHTITMGRVDETHDRVCAHYRGGGASCFG